MDEQQLQQQRAGWARPPAAAVGYSNARHEQLDADGRPRPLWATLFDRMNRLGKSDLRLLAERMAATMREMDVTFKVQHGPLRPIHRRKPWDCDIIPHIFDPIDWAVAEEGISQRLKAFELFLADVYGQREILRAGVLPLRPVLGSPAFLHAALGVPPTAGCYLHLCGICLTRDATGQLAVKNHLFTRGVGISYMMQNRRILSRVHPDIFLDLPVASISETPLRILSHLREISPTPEGDFTAVLLSPGPGSPSYSEHSFLARRMGLLLVQGGDLVVLDDKVYLKSVGGLERVEAIYNRLSHPWLDPLVCRRESLLGVPGIVHCLRRGSVAMMNSFGSELADDRSLLPFSNAIIRFYLGERPLLPTLDTFWMGDIDQREMVLADLASYRIRPLFGDEIVGNWRGLPLTAREERDLRSAVRRNPQVYVAQPSDEGGVAFVYNGVKRQERFQDHLLFALREGGKFHLFPGALTRVSGENSPLTTFGMGGGSKDSWVLFSGEENEQPDESILVKTEADEDRKVVVANNTITSRVAESFYWLGRYLERLNSLAFMIQVIESLEIEELNASERRHYRPIWSRLLPPIEGSDGGRRSIGSRADRYALLLRPGTPENGTGLVESVMRNANSIQDSLSPESWAVLAELRDTFARCRFQPGINEARAAVEIRSLADAATRLPPLFFAMADSTLLANEGRILCGFGQHLERAIITANAILAIQPLLHAQITRGREAEHATEIELSAFLRFLGSRDAYRKVYQMRARPIEVLELLYRNPEVPHSVRYCLDQCAGCLRQRRLAVARGTMPVLEKIELLLVLIDRVRWERIAKSVKTEAGSARNSSLSEVLTALYDEVSGIHDLVTDRFLSHQAHISSTDGGWEAV